MLSNDSDDAAGDALTAALVSGPEHAATFNLNLDCSFSYTHIAKAVRTQCKGSARARREVTNP